MPRHFRIEEAMRLLPEVGRRIEAAMAAKLEYEDAERSVQATLQHITMSGGTAVNTRAVAAERARRDSSLTAVKEGLDSIHELGCQVKDLDIGLIDFPTLLHGREVLLCWKLGEPAIEWWHNLEDGFRGRQPVDADFLAAHEGDGPE